MERKWRTGKPGVLPLIGLQRTDTTEWLNDNKNGENSESTEMDQIIKENIFLWIKILICMLCMYIWTYSFIKNKGQKSRRKNHIWQVGRLPVTPFMCKQIKWLVKKIPRCKWILMQNIGPNIPHTHKICMTNINIKNFNILNIKKY